jgi:hypothetical protein
MPHHLQMSYPSITESQTLLSHLKTRLSGFGPEHIAIGVLNNTAHVYIEFVTPFRRDAVSKNFLDYQGTKPIFAINVKNFIPFRKMFAARPTSVLEERNSIFKKTALLELNIAEELTSFKDKVKQVAEIIAQDQQLVTQIKEHKTLCDDIIRSSPEESTKIIPKITKDFNDLLAQNKIRQANVLLEEEVEFRMPYLTAAAKKKIKEQIREQPLKKWNPSTKLGTRKGKGSTQ